MCLKQEVYKTAKQTLQIFIQINRRVQLQGYYSLAIVLARKTFGPDTSHIVFNYHLADPSMAGAAEYVWGMVIIGTHRLQSHLQLSEGVMTCTIPDKDFQHVPPRQVERLEAHEDIFILGNGYPALRYLLVCRSDDGQSVLFRGPAAMADCIYCKKMPLKTVVIKLTGHLENRPDWDQPLIRFKAWMAASGECLKADGWLLPSSDRIYPRQIQDLVRHHIEDSHGPNVEWRFIGRAMNLLPPMTPLWEPRCTEVTPKMRLWSKMVPPCVRMYNSIDLDM